MSKTSIITFFLLSSLLISCEDNQLGYVDTNKLRANKTGLVELQVDHYKQVAYGPFPGLYHISQQGDEIGEKVWHPQYDPITSFDYEWGYRYRLLANKHKFEPQAIDGPAYEYEVIEVLSKSKVSKNEHFKITLKISYDDGGSDNFLNGDPKSGFSVLGVKDFNCGNFCDELSEIEKVDKTVFGVFQHSTKEGITLIGLGTK